MQTRIDLLNSWLSSPLPGGCALRFPLPEQAAGFLPWGFSRRSDSAADLTGWTGFLAELRSPRDGADTLAVTALFADSEPLTLRTPVLFTGGKAEVWINLEDFPVETARCGIWRFTAGLDLVLESGRGAVVSCEARRRPALYLSFPVRGRAAEKGETAVFSGQVCSCTGEPVSIAAEQIFEGWEGMTAEIRLERQILAPGESCGITVSLTVPEQLAPGAHEKTVIRVRCQQGSDTVTLRTLRRLPHPFLYHTAEGWKKVRENILRYEPYHAPAKVLRDRADAWTVTDPLPGRSFCFELKTEDSVMSAAYMLAISGDRRYGEKLLDFFRRFSGPDGYPARLRGCSASYVQEGHFFKHLAVAWDILCASGLPGEEDRAAMERVFRLYLEILDTHILSGQISNWILSELQGALFSALVLEDMDQALRFTFGPGGITRQFSSGIFSDGWWHECSVGYNTWVSSMMLHIARALQPFGIDLTHALFPVPASTEVRSSYAGRPEPVLSGMYNRRWGGTMRGAVSIRDMFDAPLPFLDWRGVLFGIADSDEKRLSGVHFGSTYDLAYQYYRDPAYLAPIARNEPDPVFGDPETHMLALRSMDPEGENRPCAHADNIGIAVLRSCTPDRPPREQIQAVLRYGSHGGAHGHFDIGDLLSVMRYGRSFYNPENCWWGYAHFMYKFYVQCSLTKNMVTADRKMQEPADSRLILWKTGPDLQAAGVEVTARWCFPPYGGMVYYQDGQKATKEDLRKRAAMNRCWLPVQEGEGSPVYGEMTGFTEPILQRRVLAVADDFLVLFDFMEGQEEHRYDSLLQIKGFQSLEGAEFVRHTEQMDPSPISDAQFVTDCRWYRARGGTVARFCTVFTQDQAGEQLTCDRSSWNEPGNLHMDVHTAWPKETEQMLGRVAVYDGWAADGSGYTIPIRYRLDVDGKTADQGAFDGWILGRGELSADVTGAETAVLALKQGNSSNELGDPVETPQGVFWGDIQLTLESGEILHLGQLMADGRADFVTAENLDTSCGIGRDYRNGRVTIVGTEYPWSVGASPLDHREESRIRIRLAGLRAVRLTACVGVDAFAGDESQRRMTYAVGVQGRTARFITVIEPYEDTPAVRKAEADSPDSVRVTLQSGRVLHITLRGMEEGAPEIFMEEEQA